MDTSIPKGAAILLDFISGPESRGDYTVIYGNHQHELATPITATSLNRLLTAQALWGKQWGSSAAGRYQIMPATLKGLMSAMKLTGGELFDPDMQDRLGYALLKRRGYAAFMARQLTTIQFAKNLAQEWASFPVLMPTQGAHRMLVAGQSYYAGDGLNHALVSPQQVEAALAKAHAASA